MFFGSDLPADILSQIGAVRAEELASAVLARVEAWLGRSLSVQIYSDFHSGSGGDFVFLDYSPLVEVLELKVCREDWSVAPLGDPCERVAKRAFLDQSKGVLIAPLGWPVGKHFFEDGTGHCRNSDRRNIFVRYRAGFASLPADLKFLLGEDARLMASQVDWRVSEESTAGGWRLKLRNFGGSILSPSTLKAFSKYRSAWREHD